MRKKELLKRYLVFLIGLFINSFGVSFVTKSNLGTSPISSIPYVLSLGFIPTLGVFTILFSLLLIALQIIILGKNFKIINLLQVPVSILFGYFIDFSMILLAGVAPVNYVLRFISLIAGCLILGFGVYIEVIANVVMLPGEAFVKAVTQRFHTEFGTTKVCFDASMTILAGILSLVMFTKLNGVGIGTVVAALIVGIIARFFGKVLSPLTTFLFGESTDSTTCEISPVQDSQAPHLVITIGREYGSGGREIGKQLAEQLGISYYDSNLLALVATETGKSPEYLEKTDQKLTNSFLFDLYKQCNAYMAGEQDSLSSVYESEKKVINDLANRESCVIVGRLANFMLPHNQNTLHVFLHGALESKINHVMSRDQLSYQDAKRQIQKVEKERQMHCLLATGKEWGMAKYYDLSINTSGKKMDAILSLITNYLEQ